MEMKPGYKLTEVGLIPQDWKVSRLGQLTDIDADNLSASTPIDFAFNYISLENVDRGVLRSFSNQVFGSAPSRARRKIRRGDILISTVRPNLKSHLLFQMQQGNWICSTGFSVVRCNHDIIASGYIYAHFFASIISKQIESFLSGSNYPAINSNDVKALCIPLPSILSEQQAIAEALSDADALIESLEQLIAKKRQIKQAAMQELLHPKEGWLEKKLGDTSILKARIGWQGLTTAEYLDSGNFFLVTGTDFKDGCIDWNNCPYIAESRYKQDKYIQLKEYDIIVTKDGTIGKVALVKQLEKPATLNSGVFVIRPIGNSFYPVFFYYILCSNFFVEFLSQLSAGSTINHLYQKDFVNFMYKTPATIEEQTIIASTLSDMDAEITTLVAKLNKTRQIKQGMMHNLLTGRIRLI